MFYLVGYDVETTTESGRKRLTKVAKICCNYGQRVQNSLFECSLSGSEYVIFKAKLLGIIDVQTDSLRIYNLGKNYSTCVEHYGTKDSYNPDGNLII